MSVQDKIARLTLGEERPAGLLETLVGTLGTRAYRVKVRERVHRRKRGGAPTAPATAGDIATRAAVGELGRYLAAYIPVGIITLFTPVWAAIVTSESDGQVLPRTIKFLIALALGLLTFGYVWGTSQQATRIEAKRAGQKPKPALATLRAGAWEISAGGLAAFTWATAVPSSWLPTSQAWVPLGLVTGVSAVLTVFGMFFAPLPEDQSPGG